MQDRPRLISPEYAELNRKLHADEPGFGASAGKMAWHVVQVAQDNGLDTILDYGSGKGTLKTAIKKIAPRLRVLEFDPAIKGKNVLPKPPDLGLLVALDVMEHIEPEYLTSVLETMHGLKPKAVYLMISVQKAQKTLSDGRNAHLIVESADWWEARLRPYFKPVHEQKTESHYRFIGLPV